MTTNHWGGHAPDLVRDNRLMHERIAEQDREILRLRTLLGEARPALNVETVWPLGYRQGLAEAIDKALGATDETKAVHEVGEISQEAWDSLSGGPK